MTDQRNHPAFPCEAQPDRGVPPEHDYIQTGIYSGKFPGMTLRDWFASQAAPHSIALGMEFGREGSPMPLAAKFAYEFADAMLAERAKATAA